jgi:hypothetical protein
MNNIVLNPEVLDNVELDNLLYVLDRAMDRLRKKAETIGLEPWERHMHNRQFRDMESQFRVLSQHIKSKRGKTK